MWFRLSLLLCQVAELCEAANKEVSADQAVRIANFLCNGNYAVSGGIEGCEAVEKLAKSFKARWVLFLRSTYHRILLQECTDAERSALCKATFCMHVPA